MKRECTSLMNSGNFRGAEACRDMSLLRQVCHYDDLAALQALGIPSYLLVSSSSRWDGVKACAAKLAGPIV